MNYFSFPVFSHLHIVHVTHTLYVCFFPCIKNAFEFFEIFLKLIEVKQKSSLKLELTNEGKAVADSGSHEALIFCAIPEEGILQSEIMVKSIF